GRRTARSGAAVVLTPRTEILRPDLTAIEAIQRDGDALAVAKALDEDAVAGDGQRAVTGAEVLSGPERRRTAWRPLCEQPGFRRDAASVRPAPLGPVSHRR